MNEIRNEKCHSCGAWMDAVTNALGDVTFVCPNGCYEFIDISSADPFVFLRFDREVSEIIKSYHYKRAFI